MSTFDHDTVRHNTFNIVILASVLNIPKSGRYNLNNCYILADNSANKVLEHLINRDLKGEIGYVEFAALRTEDILGTAEELSRYLQATLEATFEATGLKVKLPYIAYDTLLVSIQRQETFN